ncbi:MAG: Nucleoside 2-deoxyribosyltransferase [Candidatus Taylorbacteria bacterium]|nr:Nucleoside 2-deoxyribosyltransferase [Candidatus Taylorbacteria bacterium]
MNIYFAGSIRGGRNDQELYASIISELQKYGTVLTEHIGHKSLGIDGEMKYTDKEIYEKDVKLIAEADLVVAEVTNVSLGVGYELGHSESLKKPVVCLFREIDGKKLSAMINGNSYFKVLVYTDLEDASNKLKEFFNK